MGENVPLLLSGCVMQPPTMRFHENSPSMYRAFAHAMHRDSVTLPAFRRIYVLFEDSEFIHSQNTLECYVRGILGRREARVLVNRAIGVFDANGNVQHGGAAFYLYDASTGFSRIDEDTYTRLCASTPVCPQL